MSRSCLYPLSYTTTCCFLILLKAATKMGVIVGLINKVFKAGPTVMGDNFIHSVHSFTIVSTYCVSGA